MAGANGNGGRPRLDPFALALAALGLAGIVAEVVLTLYGKPIPGALDSIIYTCCGAVAGGYGISRVPGNGVAAANGGGGNVARGAVPDSPGVKA